MSVDRPRSHTRVACASCAALPVQTLGRLGVQWDKRTRAMRVPRDLFSNLVAVGNISISVTNGTEGSAPGPARVDYDLQSARDW